MSKIKFLKPVYKKRSAFGKSLCLFLTLMLLLQLAGCSKINQTPLFSSDVSNSAPASASIPSLNNSQPDFNKVLNNDEITVTDQPLHFVNAQSIPEGADTEYIHTPDLKQTDPKRIFYGAGTSTKLTGRIVVALFFTDDDVSQWDAQSVQAFTEDNVLPALEFVKKEAAKRNIPLSFEIWRFSGPLSQNADFTYNGTVNPVLFDGGSTKDLPAQISRTLGYSCDMAFRWALLQKANGADVVPIFLLNKSGISYARNVYIVGSNEQAEHAVVFSTGEDGRRMQAATFAHELLHLYGAEELYTPVERYSLAASLYPNDIMCLESRNLNTLNIGAFTAFALGWSHQMPSVCQNQQWYTDSYYQNFREWYS